jgi:DnaJ domain
MFERGNKSQGPLKPVVKITLSDGRELNGSLVVPAGRTLSDHLNNVGSFIEFEPAASARTFIAKSDVRSILPLNIGPAPNLPPLKCEDLDPFAVLGVTAEANKEEVHRAYLHLARLYHPDRYSTSGLPTEVCDYLSSMARRINAAHEAVEAARKRLPAQVAREDSSAG